MSGAMFYQLSYRALYWRLGQLCVSSNTDRKVNTRDGNIYHKSHRKIPIICHSELIFVQKEVWWAYFRGGLFSEGLI